MGSVAPPRHTKTPTAAHRNVVERRDENLIVVLIKTYKSRADTPRLKSTGSRQLTFEKSIYDENCTLKKKYLL